MADIQISDMLEMQRALWALHREKWSPMEPEYGRLLDKAEGDRTGPAIRT